VAACEAILDWGGLDPAVLHRLKSDARGAKPTHPVLFLS